MGALLGAAGLQQWMGWRDTAAGAQASPSLNATGHRWFLLKIHLKAPMTLARIAKARADVEAEPCHLCGGQTDAVEHVTTCELVCGAYDIVARSARLPANPGGMRTLMLQERMDGGTLAGIVAFYAAIWTTRRTCRRLGRTISVS